MSTPFDTIEKAIVAYCRETNSEEVFETEEKIKQLKFKVARLKGYGDEENRISFWPFYDELRDGAYDTRAGMILHIAQEAAEHLAEALGTKVKFVFNGAVREAGD